MDKPRLLIVTGSRLKFQELSAGLSQFFDCEQADWNEPEIQGTPEEILRHKLNRAYEIYQKPVLVDDSSAHFEALNGFPGPYMKDFFECMTPYEIGEKFAGSKIRAVCRLGICRGIDDFIIAEGEFAGRVVVPERKDHNGRYYDLFVVLDGMDKPMIELSIEEKNKVSHRGKAMDKLLELLKDKKF